MPHALTQSECRQFVTCHLDAIATIACASLKGTTSHLPSGTIKKKISRRTLRWPCFSRTASIFWSLFLGYCGSYFTFGRMMIIIIIAYPGNYGENFVVLAVPSSFDFWSWAGVTYSRSRMLRCFFRLEESPAPRKPCFNNSWHNIDSSSPSVATESLYVALFMIGKLESLPLRACKALGAWIESVTQGRPQGKEFWSS